MSDGGLRTDEDTKDNDSKPYIRARNDYLWKSPEGLALPGVQHQLLLHLLGTDRTWLDNVPWDFSAITAWLQQYWPQNMVSERVLTAVACDYLSLPDGSKAIYFFPTLMPSTNTSLIDPALFGTPVELPMSDNFHFDAGAIPKTFTCLEPHLRDSLASTEELSSDPAFDFSLISNTTADTTLDTKTIADVLPETGSTVLPPQIEKINRPTTPPAAFIEATLPSRPRQSHLVEDLNTKADQRDYLSKSPSPPDRKRTTLPVFAMDPIANTDYPQTDHYHIQGYAVVAAMYSKTKQAIKQSGNVDNNGILLPTSTNKQPLGIITNNVSANNSNNLPPPDTTKYSNTSARNWTIPTSEAEAFIAHFKPGFDPLPEKIEGYYWYCDECYEKVEKRGPPKGQYRSRRSVEKHFTDVHKRKWNATLPEPTRSGRTTRGRQDKVEKEVVVAADQESQKSGVQSSLHETSTETAEAVDSMKENELPEAQDTSTTDTCGDLEVSEKALEQDIESAAAETQHEIGGKDSRLETTGEPDVEPPIEEKSTKDEAETWTTAATEDQSQPPMTNKPEDGPDEGTETGLILPPSTPLPDHDGKFVVDREHTQRKLFLKEIEQKLRSSSPASVQSKSSEIDFDDIDTSVTKKQTYENDESQEGQPSSEKENVHVDFAPKQKVRFFNKESPPDRGEHKEEKDEQEEIYEPVKADVEPVLIEDKVTEKPLAGKKAKAKAEKGVKRKAEDIGVEVRGGRQLRSRTKK